MQTIMGHFISIELEKQDIPDGIHGKLADLQKLLNEHPACLAYQNTGDSVLVHLAGPQEDNEELLGKIWDL